MTTDHMNQTITLKDGRALGYAEWGDPQGVTVFHFHASGSSRLERPTDESVLADLGIQYVTTDRPGHGLSDPQPRRKLLNWPDDVSQLADHLGIDRFYVLGYSAGGPYALACARELPERVLGGAVISTGAPADSPKVHKGLPFQLQVFRFVMRYVPPLVRLFRRKAYVAVKDGLDIASLLGSFPPEDRQVVAMHGNKKMLIEMIEEGYRQGWEGIAQDDIVLFNRWGFRVKDITVPMDIWHGALDKNWPPVNAQFLHETIPHSRLTIWPDLGHLALLSHWREVLEALVG